MRIMRALWRTAPPVLFVMAILSAGFFTGAWVVLSEVFPYDLLAAADKTLRTWVESRRRPDAFLATARFVNVAPESVAERRIEFLVAEALADPVLFSGGPGRFAEYCPGSAGCLAVEYAGRGEVVHAYPYRPDEIERAAIVSLPYEHLPGFSFEKDARISRMSRYSNGDLLVTFLFKDNFPWGGGVARIGRDGRPVWYRRDYSHHKPTVTNQGIALVPGQRIGRGRPPVHRPPGLPGRMSFWLDCKNPYLDFVSRIDGAGRVLEEIPVFDALIASPYAPILHHTDPCDPTHVNAVHEVGKRTGGMQGIDPGDLVVSLRNLHAFGILDRERRRLKRLVRGGFFMQHDVQHYEGAKFLMFDNWGGTNASSRLLMVDVADGTETTIFPHARTPRHLRGLISRKNGNLSISPDRRRAIVTFTEDRKAVEVRIADGTVLTVFHAVHDVSHLDRFPEERRTRAVAYKLRGVSYVDRSRK